MLEKEFRVHTKWSAENKKEVSDVFLNSKTHKVYIENKSPLIVSAAKAFKGDASKYNPEDLLLSAVSSCHMMSYMYLCEKHSITLVNYSDQTQGNLVVKADGSGAFSEININPIVTILEEDKLELAFNLHAEASRLCFIANSCNVPMHYTPNIQIAN